MQNFRLLIFILQFKINPSYVHISGKSRMEFNIYFSDARYHNVSI